MPRRFGELKFSRRQIVTAAGVAVACIGIAIFYRHIDLAEIHARAERLNGPAVFAAIVVLPLVGFPVSVMHAVAGLRFGFALGIPLVALSTVAQLLLAFSLVKLLPNFFQRRFDRLHRRLPRAAHRPLTIFTMLLPGVPYFAQIYVLPLAGVPLRIFLLYGLPINFARSIAGVLFGDLSDRLTPWRLAGFVVYTIAVTAACAWSFRRLQERLKVPRATAGGRKRHA
jgi:uncharacterized membrane protein YdjX (TVP38/TMEM64 family)